MSRPDGPDSHAVGRYVADLAEWSKTQPRGNWTLGDLIVLAQFVVYGAPPTLPTWLATAFGGEVATVDGRKPRRVRLAEAMAAGWDGELYLSSCDWWRNHWIHPEDAS